MNARNTVKFKLDPKNPPAFTREQRDRLQTVAEMPDAEIDCSDIPRQSQPIQ